MQKLESNCKTMRKKAWNNLHPEVQKCANLVELEQYCKTQIYFQKSASTQTRTSLKLEDRRFCRSESRSHAALLVVFGLSRRSKRRKQGHSEQRIAFDLSCPCWAQRGFGFLQYSGGRVSALQVSASLCMKIDS